MAKYIAQCSTHKTSDGKARKNFLVFIDGGDNLPRCCCCGEPFKTALSGYLYNTFRGKNHQIDALVHKNCSLTANQQTAIEYLVNQQLGIRTKILGTKPDCVIVDEYQEDVQLLNSVEKGHKKK